MAEPRRFVLRIKHGGLLFLYRGRNLYWRLFRPVTVGARVLLVREGHVLLVRHSYRPGWYLPGGGVKKGETLAEAAGREAREEAGAVVRDLRLLGVFANFSEGKSDHVAVFVAEDFEVIGEHDAEVAEATFFPIDALPADTSPGTAGRIAEYLAGGAAVSGRW